MVTAALNSKPPGTKDKEAIFNYVVNQTRIAKTDIQNAVAKGFGDAMKEFIGTNVSYLCNIVPLSYGNDEDKPINWM